MFLKSNFYKSRGSAAAAGVGVAGMGVNAHATPMDARERPKTPVNAPKRPRTPLARQFWILIFWRGGSRGRGRGQVGVVWALNNYIWGPPPPWGLQMPRGMPMPWGPTRPWPKCPKCLRGRPRQFFFINYH